LLTLLALLALLSLLTLLRGAIAHPLVERLHASHEIARLVDSLAERVLLVRVAERGRGVADLVLQRFEVRLDVAFHRTRVLARLTLQRVLRVADLLPHALVGDAAGRFIQLPRRLATVAARFVRKLLELILQPGDLRIHRVLALAKRLRLALPRRPLLLIEGADL
jgi:hypothetical protein